MKEKLTEYQIGLGQLALAYEKAEELGDETRMLHISLSMELLIEENDTNEIRIIQ